MAINIVVNGNQLEISNGNTVDFVNMDDVDLFVDSSNTKVSLRNTSNNTTPISARPFGEFATPSGGDALIVAQAIATLMGVMASGVGVSDVSVINPSTAGSELPSIAASASSVELLPALATRVETRIRNDGTGILYVTIGATATVNSANKLLQDDWIDITEGLVVNGIWVGVNGFARMNEIVK